jgi:hypothetical protein
MCFVCAMDKKPMMWMGKLSAWMALAMGALFAVNAYFQFATGVAGWIYLAAALGLMLGGYRTLKRLSGGLRLLCGAWGFAAGLLILPLTRASASSAAFDTGGLAMALIALAGLALTVLHKEK